MHSRNLEIDKLRAMAVIFVMITHFRVMQLHIPHLSPWSGVDLFFVISGFIVAKSFLPNLSKEVSQSPDQRKEIFFRHFKAFFCRRIFRIIPPMTFVLAAYFAVSGLLVGAGFFESFPWKNELIAIYTYVYNFYFVHDLQTKLAWHWSLSVEEQFYICLPFFIYFTRKEKTRKLLVGGAILLFSLVLRPVFQAHETMARTEYLTQYRADGILYGLFLFYLSEEGVLFNRMKPSFLLNRRILSFGVSLFLLGMIAFAPALNDHYHFNVTMLAINIPSFLLVYLASFGENIILPMPHSTLDSALNWIGKRSYGLYLLHMPVVESMRNAWKLPVLQEYWFHTYGIYLVLTLGTLGLCAEMVYQFVEKPCIKKGTALSRKILNHE